jgi:hypothetical protein
MNETIASPPARPTTRRGVAVIVVAFLVCTPGQLGRTSSDSSGIGKQDAVRIAAAFLKQQPFGDDYIADSPVVTSTRDARKNWLVVFRHVDWQTHRPGRGIVMVDRVTGDARWVPVR